MAGVTLAGVPVVILGQNQHYAWGFTNVMVDDTDFYVEVTDDAHPDQYFYDGEWRDMVIHEEIINVKGEEPVVHIVSHGRSAGQSTGPRTAAAGAGCVQAG